MKPDADPRPDRASQRKGPWDRIGVGALIWAGVFAIATAILALMLR